MFMHGGQKLKSLDGFNQVNFSKDTFFYTLRWHKCPSPGTFWHVASRWGRWPKTEGSWGWKLWWPWKDATRRIYVGMILKDPVDQWARSHWERWERQVPPFLFCFWFFLVCYDTRNIKFTTLTIFRCTIEWHYVYSHCCATITCYMCKILKKIHVVTR